ncbi:MULTISPECIES: ricin-type beta-trefoil lectin domain protein [Catenuloplanes]|uniref:Ricin B lectin domain-containing protein n=1 Tax=Catenuloplanes niger TaxID=587534 RepID=A0AAE4CV62_9ACTN|nr:ricin-type beta-trefoil lectin domain protein [Catenuloplanes niger]MDR7325900.1 hypothetical protein [Catenuloplanes niger]
MRTTMFPNLSRWLGELGDRIRARGGLRRGVAGMIVAGVAIIVASAATIGFGIANAANDELTGRSVTDEQFSAIASAARSCPMLTPARMAGQLMAESGLNASETNTASGGRGLAGLDDEDWKNWAPWPDAKRDDTSAAVLALAHQMCDLSGQIRVAGVQGDEWRLSLAAFRSGLPEVTKAKGVPGAADEYVDRSTAYAAYYATLPQFGGTDARPNPNASAAEVKPLPEEYVAPVKAAGSVCGEIPPATVAAVLMASSEFNSNKLGTTGEQGVAQFRGDVWARYGPEGASAWDPVKSIPAVGAALCGLITELNGLEGDPSMLALAAYRNGPETVRQAVGAPDGETQAFIETVLAYADYYAMDSRIAVAPKPSATPSASKSPKPGTTGGTSPQRTPAPAPSSEKPKPPEGTQFVQVKGGHCLAPGDPATIQPCDPMAAKQRWQIGADGTIRSKTTGQCLDVVDGKTDNVTPVRTWKCNGSDAQRWRIENSTVYTALADNMCLDVDVDAPAPGARVVIWFCVNHDKQSWTPKS